MKLDTRNSCCCSLRAPERDRRLLLGRPSLVRRLILLICVAGTCVALASLGMGRIVSANSGASSHRRAFFPYEQGWLGADSAYSIPLGEGKSVWLLGDTFVGAPNATSRQHATGFIHNSIAITSCTGQDCSFHYYWAGMNTPKPAAVFSVPGSSSDWFWPMDGFVYHGTLYIALMQMHAQGTGAFGFAYSGAQLASVSNYLAKPSQWSIRYQKLSTGENAVPGASIVVDAGPDGNPDPANPHGADYAYFFTVVPKANSSPFMALLRLPLSQLNSAARPGNASWEYLKSGSKWSRWSDTATSLPGDAAAVINPGATEMTVRYHASTKQWIAVYPIGMDGQAHYSLSASLLGPWGPSESLYAYPEMQQSNTNYTRNVFCYAAKEHVELERAGQLFFTYVCNSIQVSDITKNMNLYHPVAVTKPLPH